MNSKQNNNRFFTAGFNVCPSSGQIRGTEKAMRLGPVNLRVLLVLLENQGQVVSRAKLFDQVWKNQVVSDDSLTRCVSDIRLQLGELAPDTKLIETIPKRGYRWLEKVSVLQTPEIVKSEELQLEKAQQKDAQQDGPPSQKSKWKPIALWTGSGIASFLLLSTVALWSVSHYFDQAMVRVALLPIQTAEQSHQNLAIDFEDELRRQLLSTTNIRFLSSRTHNEGNNKLYPYLSREFAAQWIIEGRIRVHKDLLRVSINLVDARTAIVHDSTRIDISADKIDVESLANGFVVFLKNKIE